MKVLSLPSNLKKAYKHWKKLQNVKEFYSERNWLESMSGANQLIESMENDFFRYYYRGLCNLELKFFDEALTDFQLAKANADKNKFPKLMEEYREDVSLRIAITYRVQRNYETAFEFVNSTIKEFPNYLEGYKLKASIYEDLEQITQALDSINSGLKIDPTDSELLKYKDHLVYVFSVEQNEKRIRG